MVTALAALARKRVGVPLQGDQGVFASPAWESTFGFFLGCAAWRGPGFELCPLCPFLLAYLVISQILRYQTIWLKSKGSCALRDTGRARWGAGGTLTLERISNPDSCQGKAGPSIEQSSSCMRVDHANSIERDPSAQPFANKVIFPNLLRQKGGTLPVLVLSM